MKPIRNNILLACAGFALAAATANAAVIVTDNGLTAPTLGVNDTGYTGAMNARFGFDAGETHGQTFTLTTGGNLGSIFIGYNGFDADSGNLTITVDIGNDGGPADLSETIALDGANFSGANPGDNNVGPNYWMKWDLSSNNLALPAGASSFLITMNSETASSWLFAPTYNTDNPYAGGRTLGIAGGPVGNDALFAVTVNPIPEPSAAALLGLAAICLAGRRRKR